MQQHVFLIISDGIQQGELQIITNEDQRQCSAIK